MAKQIVSHNCIFLSKNNLVFFMPELVDVATLTMPIEVFQDLEIVSEPGLERVIKNWLQQTKLKPNSTVVLIDDANYFFQDVNKDPTSVTPEELQAFADTAPFNDVVTKAFPTRGGSRIIAINRDLLYPLVTVLEKCGFSILCVSPAFAAGVSGENPFTKELANAALKTQSLYQLYNFVTTTQLEQKIASEKSFFSVQVNKQLIVMVVVLLGLVAVLIGLLLMQRVSA